MTGYEPWTSGFRNNCSTNWTTTTALNAFLFCALQANFCPFKIACDVMFITWTTKCFKDVSGLIDRSVTSAQSRMKKNHFASTKLVSNLRFHRYNWSNVSFIFKLWPTDVLVPFKLQFKELYRALVINGDIGSIFTAINENH